MFHAHESPDETTEKINWLDVVRGVTIGNPRHKVAWLKVGEDWFKGRLCVIKLPEAEAEKQIERVKNIAKRKGYKTSERSLTWAQFLCVWTSLSEEEFSCLDILEIYRWRWQVELIFKRAKSLMELKHLPTTRNRATAEAWLQGEFLYIMLVELLVERASSFSPWGEGPLAEVHVGPVCALT